MKKTILAGAVVLAFSTLATAQDIEGVQTETIADNKPIANTTLNLKDNAEYTVTGVTNQFGLLNNSPVKGENATLILNAKGTRNVNAALGDGGSNINVNRVNISSQEWAIYSSNLGSDHYIDANYVSITSGNKDAIYTDGHNVEIIGKESINIKSSSDSGISNNGVGLVSLQGKTVSFNFGSKNAIENIKSGTTKILANEIVIDGNGSSLEERGAVMATAGAVELVAENSISVSVGSNDANALYSSAAGKLGISSPETEINGNIQALGETQLNGELVFNGNEANVANLTGEAATFTLTKADQEVSITNHNEALIVAATGDLNDEVGMDAFKNLTVGGEAEGVQVVAREGMYTGETTGLLNESFRR